MQGKLNNPARNNLNHWFHKNARLLKRKEFDKHNHALFYSVAGTPVIVLDMYRKDNGDYAGFEIFMPTEADDLNEAIDKLESLTD